MRLEGKVALISGGGMGAAEVIGDVLEEDGRKVEAEIVDAGGRSVFVRLDVTREADWTRAVAETVDRFGALTVLVNNAAIRRTEAVLETTEEAWDSVMSVTSRPTSLAASL